MKILITSIVDLRTTPHNRLHEFVRHLSRNHDLTVLSLRDRAYRLSPEATATSTGLKLVPPNVRFVDLNQKKVGPALQEFLSVFGLARLMDSLDARAFDLHLNYSSLVSGQAVAQYMRRLGKRTVYDIADDLAALVGSSPLINPWLRPGAAFFASLICRRNMESSHRITLITESLRRSLGAKHLKTSLVPNGVDAELFYPRDSRALKSSLGLDQCFVLGYAGALREWLDLESVYQALSQVVRAATGTRLKLLIVGEGNLAVNRLSTRKYGIEDRVVFVGGVDYDKLPSYISCMDVGLIPFKQNAVTENALPLKLFEYLACEKPIIAPPLAGIKEIAGERITYAASPEEVSQRIVQLMADQAAGKNNFPDARRFVAENYSWKTACSRLEEILLDSAGK